VLAAVIALPMLGLQLSGLLEAQQIPCVFSVSLVLELALHKGMN
jgi:hypothetical protein